MDIPGGIALVVAGHVGLHGDGLEAGEAATADRRVSWGLMKVEGLGAGKDFKLYPGGGRAWDWAETGTRHSPGVQPADVEELMAHGATIVVLSQSMNKQLHVHPDTYRYLEERFVTVQVTETREAIKIYNDLAEGALVAGLFHSRC
jgi:hypothetical protein